MPKAPRILQWVGSEPSAASEVHVLLVKSVPNATRVQVLQLKRLARKAA